ncbi:MAG: hypothetical protein KAS32_31705, partial [Candidatus Peribacteraceae bacterium]|nr:hypothetical protein [Candidatus Peribacteraceae bacterium]
RVDLSKISTVAATGGGSKKRINGKLLGIPIKKVDEIKAIGLGGMYLTGKRKCFVVSIGTGTAMVSVKEGGKEIKHIGGTGIGGGTLSGLYQLLLNKRDINSLEVMAKKGNLGRVDLKLRDIVGKGIGKLPASATAANFAKLSDNTTSNDIAKGILNMVAEIIGTMSVFAAKNYGLEKDIVFVGKVTKNKILMRKIQEVVKTFRGSSMVPLKAEFATAIGAAKSLD